MATILCRILLNSRKTQITKIRAETTKNASPIAMICKGETSIKIFCKKIYAIASPYLRNSVDALVVDKDCEKQELDFHL